MGLKRAVGADFESGYAVSGIVDGAGGAGEVEDVVEFAIVGGIADVVLFELEACVVF